VLNVGKSRALPLAKLTAANRCEFAFSLRSHARFATTTLARRPWVCFEEWDVAMVSAIRGVREPIGIAGGDALYPERAAASLGPDRIVADPGEIVARAPDIIIIGSSCGKKFRPDQAAARPGWTDVARGARRRTPRDQVAADTAAGPGRADRWPLCLSRHHRWVVDNDLGPSLTRSILCFKPCC
jgi:hypothetical protein